MKYFILPYIIILLCGSLFGQSIEITIEDILLINGNKIDSTTTIQEVKKILGATSSDILLPEPNKRKASLGYYNSNHYIFHSLGLVIIEDADRKRIDHIQCYFKKPTWHSRYKPNNTFKGDLAIRNYKVMELSEISFQNVSDKSSEINNFSEIMCGSFALVFDSENQGDEFYALSIGIEYNTTNSLGWSDMDKSFFFRLYSEEDPDFTEFAKRYNCDKSILVKCMIDKASSLFLYDDFFHERIPPEEMSKVLTDCVLQTQN